MTWSQREVALDDVDGTWFVVAATGDPRVDAGSVRAGDRRARLQRLRRRVPSTAPPATRRSPTTPACGWVWSRVGRPDPARVVRGPQRPGPAPRDRRAGPARPAAAPARARRAGRPRRRRPGRERPHHRARRRALAEADVVVTDRLGPTGCCARSPHDVEVIDVGKTAGTPPRAAARDQPHPRRAGAARAHRRAAQGRGPVRLRTRRRGGPRLPRGRCRRRGGAGRELRAERAGRPAYPSPTAAPSGRCTSSTATSGSTRTRRVGGAEARHSSSSWEFDCSTTTCVTSRGHGAAPTCPWRSSRTRRRSASA